jgi:MYXO-CTERM domain-containing protein
MLFSHVCCWGNRDNTLRWEEKIMSYGSGSKHMHPAAFIVEICACTASIFGAASPSAAATNFIAPADAVSNVAVQVGSLSTCFSGGAGLDLCMNGFDTTPPTQPNVFPLAQTFAFGSASVTNPGPSVNPSLQAVLNVNNSDTLAPSLEGSITAFMTYSFVINGPSGLVGVDFSGQVGGNVTGTTQGPLDSIVIVGVQSENTVYSLTDPITGAQQQSISQQLSLSTGVQYIVQLEAAAVLENCCSTFPATASAFIDPIIAIDPSTPEASSYSLSFSSNLTPTLGAPAPEASTWALLLLGFGGLALIRRRSLGERAIAASADSSGN